MSKIYPTISRVQMTQKRLFDLLLACLVILASGWLICLAWIAASIDTRSNGLFFQRRVGRNAKLFNVVKIKTMRPINNINTTVTQLGDPRITWLGAFFRRTKIDELPQLWNVLIGEMSFVGPRPDVPGFADKLHGEALAILSIRPGITGPATLKYHNEELILSKKTCPELYNKNVIWPDKVRINIEYIRTWSLRRDIQYILETVFN